MNAKASHEMPHLGQMLRHHLKTNKLYRSSLARALNRTDAAMLRYEKYPSLQARLLWELSMALKHNFFADIADQMPKGFTTEVVADTAKDDRITALEREVEILSKQLEVLKEVMRR